MNKDNEKPVCNSPKVFMRGYKGFKSGLVCEPDGPKSRKQYTEQTVFEEAGNKCCEKGVMHFCENPLNVFSFYAPIDGNEFAEVEALGDVLSDDNIKFCTNKLRIGRKLSLTELIQAGIKYIVDASHVSNKKKTTNNDNVNAVTNGEYSNAITNGWHANAITNGNDAYAITNGDRSNTVTNGEHSNAITNGDFAHSAVSCPNSIAIAIGHKSSAKGALGCWLVLAEHKTTGELLCVKTIKVDGEIIKANTYYLLKDGEFVEA